MMELSHTTAEQQKICIIFFIFKRTIWSFMESLTEKKNIQNLFIKLWNGSNYGESIS